MVSVRIRFRVRSALLHSAMRFESKMNRCLSVMAIQVVRCVWETCVDAVYTCASSHLQHLIGLRADHVQTDNELLLGLGLGLG